VSLSIFDSFTEINRGKSHGLTASQRYFRRLWIGESAVTSSASAYCESVCEPYCRRWRTAEAVARRRARQALSLERYVENLTCGKSPDPRKSVRDIWRTIAARKEVFSIDYSSNITATLQRSSNVAATLHSTEKKTALQLL